MPIYIKLCFLTSYALLFLVLAIVALPGYVGACILVGYVVLMLTVVRSMYIDICTRPTYIGGLYSWYLETSYDGSTTGYITWMLMGCLWFIGIPVLIIKRRWHRA